MKRPELLLGAVLVLFAGFVGAQIVSAPRPPATAALADSISPARRGASDDAAPPGPVAPPDPAVAADSRRRIAERSFGTYLGEILAEQDSMLARWPDRGAGPIRVWVQPTSAVDGWSPQHPQFARDAFLAWEQAGLPIHFAFLADSASADVHVLWVDRVEPAPRIGSTLRLNDQRGWVVRGVIRVATHGSDGRVLDEAVVRATALHEVGHLIGLDHTADTTSIMAGELHETHMLSASDKATAALLYALPPGSVK